MFSHPQLSCCSPQGVAASASDGCRILQVFFFLSALRAHIGELQSLTTVTSLFTDMAGNSPFLSGNLGWPGGKGGNILRESGPNT